MGSMGKLWILQKDRYEFSAEVYVRWDELSIDNPKAMDRSWTRRSNVHGSRWGWREPREIEIIFCMPPASFEGVGCDHRHHDKLY